MLFISILQFISFLIYFSLAVYILAQNSQALLNCACAIVLLFFSCWCFFLIFAQNPYADKELARMGYNLAAIGWCGFSSAALWFSLIITEQKAILEKKLLYLFLFFCRQYLFINNGRMQSQKGQSAKFIVQLPLVIKK
jgi:hypothetical protein